MQTNNRGSCAKIRNSSPVANIALLLVALVTNGATLEGENEPGNQAASNAVVKETVETLDWCVLRRCSD